ncbi:uncharacterized protein LOC118429462 [Branchiostoma floridae]|uniref:Uncharacterized protein LOC118429462 n=1 Tax=Branchiostoma floridae TaxID=7739 RepID=A0A9J7M7I2_BRAFL|nr:uncharacterized protein LOC118429462 [Branchiostoma floridae]
MALDIKLLTVVLTVTSPLVYSARAQRSARSESPYISLGCWKDGANRAIPTLEGSDPRLDGSYRARANAIEKCYQVARSRGFPMFAVQHGGWCAGSADGLNTYNKYGPSTTCAADGEGGFWGNEVYKITAPTEYDKLQSEVEALARDLPLTLQELGLTSVVQDVQELKTDEYQGCYQDSYRHKFPRKVLTHSWMTIERCTGACRDADFNYAAVERSRRSWYFHDCHCGTEEDFNDLGERVCDGECNSRCRGNSRQKCGGWYKMSVYKIDAVPSCESGPRRVSPHWYQTSTTTTLQYRGGEDTRPFAFATPTLGGDRTIPVQSTLVNLEEDIEGFPNRYPATTAEGMPDLVSDYRALLASFQAPGLELTPGTNTTLKLDQHFTIKSYPCSLEYSPTEGRGKRAVTTNIKVVSYRPFKVMIQICIY